MNDTKELIKEINNGNHGYREKGIIIKAKELVSRFELLCSGHCDKCALVEVPNICFYIAKLKECINYE